MTRDDVARSLYDEIGTNVTWDEVDTKTASDYLRAADWVLERIAAALEATR